MSKKKIIAGLVLVFMIVLLVVHNVPRKITEEDKEYLSIIFGGIYQNQEDLTFEEEIAYIDTLIRHLHQNYIMLPIDYGVPREPQDLHENSGGLCYDYSRSIEKQLMLSGFEIRHVAVYKREGGFFQTILSPGVFSHSLTEVKTKKGWLIVDSNVPFYALDVNGEIYDYKHLVKEESTPVWKLELVWKLAHFYTPDVVFVYGLYSRHGQFYPPYNFVPDYNLRELLYNF